MTALLNENVRKITKGVGFAGRQIGEKLYRSSSGQMFDTASAKLPFTMHEHKENP